MAYNPYGAPPYGPPPTFGAFPGAAAAPGMAPPPGLGAPPGMSSAPGLAPPPGVQQPASAATQANRPSGLPGSFQPPPNLPNINFNAPVIRLGGGASSLPAKPGTPSASGRKDTDNPASGGGRPGLGMERGLEQSRAAVRESMQALVPPTTEERLRTIFIHKVPESIASDEAVERFLSNVGRLRRWDSSKSHLSDHRGEMFGFAQFEDPDSLATAVELLGDVQLPSKKQAPTDNPAKEEEGGDPYEGIEKAQLQVAVDESTLRYLESYRENKDDEEGDKARVESARARLNQAVRDLFFPKAARLGQDGDGDMAMGEGAGHGEHVEVINIPLAQDDELADIPAEMREVVAAEIASFRERSNRRDLERLKREEEFEEMERQRNGAGRLTRLDSPPPNNSNSIPLGPRGAPVGPRGQNAGGRGVAFVNGGTVNGDTATREEDGTDANDDELYRRTLAKQKAEEDKQYLEAERKWVNRERQRAAALDRERDREKAELENASRRKEEQLEREKGWDDEKEASRKSHLYYRDHAAWARKRAQERADEDARDEADRRAEESERRRQAAELEQAQDMADSFLTQQAREMEQRPAASAASAAPQRFTISFGAAAQKAHAQRAGPQRRTVAEVEGLLDDEEHEQTTKRQLIPIKFEPMADNKAMSEEEITKAVRALAQEIPAGKEGLWAWNVQWDYMDESIITEKLRPFVEKKVVEYLGVQDQFLVEVVEGHLRKHTKPGEIVEELAEALEDDAEDLVKKLWRMVIFFTESEKRGLPA